MTDDNHGHCPECGSDLADGYVGYFSGIMWHEQKLAGLQRLYPFVMSTAQFIISNVASTPWIRSRKAKRCRDCGTLVVPASPPRSVGVSREPPPTHPRALKDPPTIF